MFGNEKQTWMELCELAAHEQDPKKLMALIAEIDRLLGEKKERVAKALSPAPALVDPILDKE